jgi:hypothetical protein
VKTAGRDWHGSRDATCAGGWRVDSRLVVEPVQAIALSPLSARGSAAGRLAFVPMRLSPVVRRSQMHCENHARDPRNDHTNCIFVRALAIIDAGHVGLVAEAVQCRTTRRGRLRARLTAARKECS